MNQRLATIEEWKFYVLSKWKPRSVNENVVTFIMMAMTLESSDVDMKEINRALLYILKVTDRGNLQVIRPKTVTASIMAKKAVCWVDTVDRYH